MQTLLISIEKSTLLSAEQGFHSQLLGFLHTTLQSNINLEIILVPFSTETIHKSKVKKTLLLPQKGSNQLNQSDLLFRFTAIDTTRGLNSDLKQTQNHTKETCKTPPSSLSSLS